MNRAFLVGINKYNCGQNLNGCVNDVTDMSQFLLNKCGFRATDIQMVTDSRATTVAIETGLRWLVTGLHAGDRVLFHYSGHGAQMPLGGIGEYKGLDDVICPCDFNWDPNYAISDQYFHNLFSSVPTGVELVWVSDSCHAGDLDREMSDFTSNGLRQSRTMLRPPEVVLKILASRDLNIQPMSITKAASSLNNVALIAGCHSDQTSADAYFNGRYNGALTHFLLQQLNQEDGLTISLTDLVSRVTNVMKENQFQQDPQLQGASSIENKGFLQG